MVSQFHSWQAFISMGGYGAYVWTAYGAMLLTLVLGLWTPWQQNKTLKNANFQRSQRSPDDRFSVINDSSKPLI